MIYYAFFTTLALIVWSGLSIFITLRRRRASPVPPSPAPFPSVSIIVTARDEEQAIEGAMRSLLALDYPDVEIIAVDDRSTDTTGAILDRLALAHRKIMRVVHLTELPEGWLGKCHALAQGAVAARGEWLLFTDADVVFDESSLHTAVSHAHALDADHFVFTPMLLWKGYVEAALLTLFGISISMALRVWQVESKATRAFIGLGGFNMVRRALYDRFGGHSALRLEVADDIKLGFLAKKYGGRSVVVDSDGAVRVRWREGARDVMRGIERSGFAGVEFRWWKIAGAIIFLFGIMLTPYALLFSDDILAQVLAGVAIAALTVSYAVAAHASRMPLWIGFLHPVACVLYAWAFARSAYLTTRDGGIGWRGTFYTIDELKRGTVR